MKLLAGHEPIRDLFSGESSLSDVKSEILNSGHRADPVEHAPNDLLTRQPLFLGELIEGLQRFVCMASTKEAAGKAATMT